MNASLSCDLHARWGDVWFWVGEGKTVQTWTAVCRWLGRPVNCWISQVVDTTYKVTQILIRQSLEMWFFFKFSLHKLVDNELVSRWFSSERQNLLGWHSFWCLYPKSNKEVTSKMHSSQFHLYWLMGLSFSYSFWWFSIRPIISVAYLCLQCSAYAWQWWRIVLDISAHTSWWCNIQISLLISYF